MGRNRSFNSFARRKKVESRAAMDEVSEYVVRQKRSKRSRRTIALKSIASTTYDCKYERMRFYEPVSLS